MEFGGRKNYISKKVVKIVFVDTTLQGPVIGGAQTFLPLLINGLNEQGHEVHLVTNGNPDIRIAKQIAACGAVLHSSLWKKNAFVEEAAITFAAWVNNLQPAIYVISVSPDIGWLALPHLHESIATFTIGHTDSATFYAPVRHYHSFLTKAIAVSDQVSEEYIAGCKLSPEQVAWIPYGVNVNTVPPVETGTDILQIVYVGRIDQTQKRIADVAAIVKELSARQINFHVKVIGDGPEMNSFRTSVETEIAENKVTLYGWLGAAEVTRHLQESAVFILTSGYEGFCIALVEAMANGCCPVVTDIRSGNKQLIQNQENGFLLEIGAINKFADTLEYLNQNKEELMKLRNAAWQTGKQYSVATMVKRYEKVFEEAVTTAKSYPRKKDPAFPLMDSCRSKYPKWVRKIKKMITE